MFIISQIKEAHSKVKSGADFPIYIQDLKKLGVTDYTTFVSDGHTQYLGRNDYSIQSDAKYTVKEIAAKSDGQKFKERLKIHQQGHTDFATFCNDCAETGVEKWTVSIDRMTCTYFNKEGQTLLVEVIPPK